MHLLLWQITHQLSSTPLTVADIKINIYKWGEKRRGGTKMISCHAYLCESISVGDHEREGARETRVKVAVTQRGLLLFKSSAPHCVMLKMGHAHIIKSHLHQNDCLVCTGNSPFFFFSKTLRWSDRNRFSWMERCRHNADIHGMTARTKTSAIQQ